MPLGYSIPAPILVLLGRGDYRFHLFTRLFQQFSCESLAALPQICPSSVRPDGIPRCNRHAAGRFLRCPDAGTSLGIGDFLFSPPFFENSWSAPASQQSPAIPAPNLTCNRGRGSLGNGGHMKTVRASALAALVLITIMNIVPPFAPSQRTS